MHVFIFNPPTQPENVHSVAIKVLTSSIFIFEVNHGRGECPILSLFLLFLVYQGFIRHTRKRKTGGGT